MFRNALFATVVVFIAGAFYLMQECRFLIPYRDVKKPTEVKRTITEVRVASILKLDRPVPTGEQPADNSASQQGVPF